MKSAILAVVMLLCVATSACNRVVGNAPADSARNRITLLDGDYLSTTYVEELKRTRSPLTAGKTGRIDLILVRTKGNTVHLDPMFSFHEAGAQFQLNRDGSVTARGSADRDASNLSAAVINDHTFRFGFGSFEPATYMFVKNATEFVAKTILVGRYIDSRGRYYEFREDGWAVFPSRTFRFEIGLDHVLNDYDYFFDAGPSGKVEAFRWKDESLQIFNTKVVEGIEVIENRPYASLRLAR